MDPDEFTKPGGVVIPRGFGITIGLKNGVGSHNLVLKGDLLGLLLSIGSHQSKIGDDLLGVLSLTRPGLPGNQDGLVLRL